MTCAKRQVQCVLYPEGSAHRVRGSNDCKTPQDACPRYPDEEDYTKCHSVCHQAGHAEIQALEEAKRQGVDLRGAQAHLFGHYHVCQPCAQALRDAGVKLIVIHVE